MAARAVDIAVSFVDLINSGDARGIVVAVTPGSSFFVDGEDPTVGREALRIAWSGYFAAFPNYVIFIDETHEKSDAVYLVGHTSGSHVPQEEESLPSSVIWRCKVTAGLVSEWSIYNASMTNRTRFGLGHAPAA